MKCVVYELKSPRELCQVEVAVDENLGPTQVLAKTCYTAISTGTELAAWLGKPPLRPGNPYPRLVGYCNLAKVIKRGSDVTSVLPGDYVLTHQSHRSGFVCDQSEVLFSIGQKSERTLKALTATYVYHLGYTALLAGGFEPKDRTAIVGMGATGVALADLLQALKSPPTIFTDQDFPDALSKKDPGKRENSYDIVVNTSNAWADYLLCLRLAKKNGVIVCLGFPGRGEPPPDFNPLDTRYFYDKQLTIKSCGHTDTLNENMRYLCSLVLEGAIDPSRILSFENSWEKLGEAYARLASRPPRVFSALLKWDES